MSCFQSCVGAILLSVISLNAHQAYGQLIPYRSQGTDAVFQPASGQINAAGITLHLGKSLHAGKVALVPTGQLTGNFESIEPLVTTASNGDELRLYMKGQYQLMPVDLSQGLFSAVWKAEATIIGGSGRFAQSKPGPQPLSVLAVNEPFRLSDAAWKFSWQISGSFRLR